MVRIRIKIKKGTKKIDKVITIQKSSIQYFIAALKKYGWEWEVEK